MSIPKLRPTFTFDQERIEAPLIEGWQDDIFICLDSALTDEAKVRLEDGRRVKVI